MSQVTQLGYLGFEVKDLGVWEKFADETLGLTVVQRSDEGFRLRLDSRAYRIIITGVTGGQAEDLALVGWQVGDEAALSEIVSRIEARGIEVSRGDASAARERGVQGLARFCDPAGIRSELFYGPELASTAFEPKAGRSGFVAEELGLGHIVLTTKNKQESLAFYQECLGFRLSDRIVTSVYGHKVDLDFLHINSRHHTLALGGPLQKKLHHFMLESCSVDDVGLVLDRTLSAGLKIIHGLGRHPNDRMLSFYAETPSGFHFEFGWGARQIDDSTWQTQTYDCISEWGHRPPSLARVPHTAAI